MAFHTTPLVLWQTGLATWDNNKPMYHISDDPATDYTKSGWKRVADTEVTFEFPDYDPVQAEIDKLKKEIDAVNAKAFQEIAKRKEEISKLLALPAPARTPKPLSDDDIHF